jgi:uncharacterized protein
VVEPQQALLSVVLLNALLVVLTIGCFWAGVLVVRSFGRKAGYSLAPLGFARPRGGSLAGIRFGAAVGAGAVIVSIPLNLATTFVFDRLGYSTERMIQGPFMRGLFHWVQQSPEAAIPAIILVVVIFGPAVEELVFRGAIFNGLYRVGRLILDAPEDSTKTARRVSFALSALISSVIFALLHLEPTLLPVLLILGVVLCALFERTGSLLPTFVAHATFNSFAVSLIILAGLGVFELPI